MTSPKATPPRLLRIIDANLDRAREGLRLLEDIARLYLNDATLTEQLKVMRHELAGNDKRLQRELLLARDSKHDLGADMEAPGELQRADLPSLVMANAKRVEESLRVIEEFAKLPDLSLRLAINFKDARFAIYDLEQRLVSRLLRREKMARMVGLYLILDTQALEGRDEVEVARQAIRGGARMIQLRDKHRSRKELLEIARGLRKLCAENEVLFIINDYLDLALAADADGLHVGQSDLPLPVVRGELPADRIIGCSTHNLDQALQAEVEGADYIAVGSIYPTTSKGDTKVVGLEVLRQIGSSVSLPLVAIGGINQDNVAEVIAAGATSVAVISAVVGVGDVEGAARKLAQEIEKALKKVRR